MMKHVFSFLLVAIVLGGPFDVQAQSNPVYNKTGSSDGNAGPVPVYNTSGNYYNAAPISIKNMVNDKKEFKTRSSSTDMSPYDFGNKNQLSRSALLMSPAQVKRKQAEDAARARNRAEQQRERQKALRARKLAAENGQSSDIQDATKKFTSRFQGDGENGNSQRRVIVQKRDNPVFVKDQNGLTTPEKVFGDIY